MRPEIPRADRWLFRAFLALLIWLPLPWGSHSPWAVATFGIAVFLLLAAWCALAAQDRVTVPVRMRRLHWPIGIWVAYLCWIALCGVALPSGVLATLSPSAHRIHDAVSHLEGGRALYSLSIAPAETWREWWQTTTLFGFYLLALLLVRSERRLRAVLVTLVISGVLQASWGASMLLSGENWGWLASKRFYLDSATGTFVNRNHFAAYLGQAGCAAIALIVADLRVDAAGTGWRARLRGLLELAFSTRLQARIGLLIIAVGLVLSRSRMGNFAFFGCVAAGGLLYVTLRERQAFFKAAFFFASVLAVDVLLVSQQFGLERVIERIDATAPEQETRADILRDIKPVLSEYGWIGSGLGTFRFAYEQHRGEAMAGYIDHAHNDYAEFLIETGAIGVTLLSCLVLWHLMHALRVVFRRQRRLKVATCFALLVAMATLGVHSLVDFNLQIPAVAATWVVLLALAAGCSERSRSEAVARARRQPLESHAKVDIGESPLGAGT